MQIIQSTGGGGVEMRIEGEVGGGGGWEEVAVEILLHCLELNNSLSANKNANLIGI